MTADSPAPVAEVPTELIPVGAYSTYAIGAERGLVVLAMGLPYWLEPAADHFVLLVEAPATAAVREQLARFERESAGWPPSPTVLPVRPLDFRSAAAWATLVLACFALQAREPQLTAQGALDAQALFARGEMWRPFTALWLHADSGHLVSNLVSGLLVFAAVASTFGRWAAWPRVFIAAVCGNILSAAVQFPEPYTSVGASTAIFAGLGMLTGRAARHAFGTQTSQRWQAVFVPAAAGFCILALYGAGGVRVDLGAHLCGFVAGTALGALARTARNVSHRSASS